MLITYKYIPLTVVRIVAVALAVVVERSPETEIMQKICYFCEAH